MDWIDAIKKIIHFLCVVNPIIFILFCTQFSKYQTDIRRKDYNQQNLIKKNFNFNSQINATFYSQIKNQQIYQKSFKKQFGIKQISLNSKNFQLLQIKRQNNQFHQSSSKNNSLILVDINVKSIQFKYINLINKLLQNNKLSNQYQNFNLYLLRSKNILSLNQQNLIDYYCEQIFTAIIKVSNRTPGIISLLASQEAAVLLFNSFSLVKQLEQSSVNHLLSKIDKVILINLYNQDSHALGRPTFYFLNSLKYQIIADMDLFYIYNQIFFVLIDTLKKFEYFIFNQDQFNKDDKQRQAKHALLFKNNKLNKQIISEDHLEFRYLSFDKTYFISTQQIIKIHQFINKQQYHIFETFVQIISDFIKQNNFYSMNFKSMDKYFRLHQSSLSHKVQPSNSNFQQNCKLYNLNAEKPTVWNMKQKCFKITITSTFLKPQNEVYLVYSNSHQLRIYSQNKIEIKQFSTLLNKSTYLLRKLSSPITIINPNLQKISITVNHIYSPSYPLSYQLSQFQILYMSQTKNYSHQSKYKSNYSSFGDKYVIRSCFNQNLMIFPDHFGPGKARRDQFLANSSAKCYKQYTQVESYFHFHQLNSIIYRNVFILIAFSFHINQFTFLKLMALTVGIYFITINQNLTCYHYITIGGLALILYHIVQFTTSLCNSVQNHINKHKIFVCMLLIMTVCCICQFLQLYSFNYWKILCLFFIFFVNTTNVWLLLIKLYDLSNSITHDIRQPQQIIQLIIYLYLTQPQQQILIKVKTRFNKIEKISNDLCLGVFAVILTFDGNYGQFSFIFTSYLRFFILLKSIQKIL